MNKSTAPAGRSGSPAKRGPAAKSAQTEPSDRPAPPRSVLIAVRLMYLGAIVTAIGVVISVIAVATDKNGLRANHPHATVAQLHATQNALITIAVLSGLIEIGVWLVMARANRAGVRWARIAATVLFAFGTLNLVSHFRGTITAGNITYSAVTWLVGLAVIVFLWQKSSSKYFA